MPQRPLHAALALALAVVASALALVGPSAPAHGADPLGLEPGDLSAASVGRSRTDPTITATVTSRRPISEFGWYRTPVRITFECTVGSAPLVGGCIGPVRLTENRRGRRAISAAISAEDGGYARVDVAGLRIDRTEPRLKVRGVRAGRTYGAKRDLRCVARDWLSGVDRCQVKQKVRHHKVRRDVVRYRAVAVDKAGNWTLQWGWYFLR